ncbi:sclerostin domain-containing protein 1-like [Syngnathus typhle]|uniref:sclerostin domain-containing protein 1-like n=1 Tax=Syngnathus typhle TaxID=161592 RepID=UPI002A6B74CC|nr:sclerostin domain-containing protein 1-like [Syngnathus typhle]
MTRLTSKVQLFAVLLFLSRSCTALSNNATESLSQQPSHVPPEDEPPTEDANRARNGGRRRQSDPMDNGPPEQSQVGCRELRSTKYISDGQCTSDNPIKELVCAGECLPAPLLPNWLGAAYAGRYWSRREAREWRCVMERSRTQRIWLRCQDGSSRTYKITVVTSCKCKRYSRQHNDSRRKDAKRRGDTGERDER